jgi:acetoin:2,6-dichlorophenolindophenol oxidoreductase subunit beta
VSAGLEYRVAIREAIDEELARDERVIMFGEDVAAAGGVFNVTPGLMETHGRERVFDTPISELAIASSAFGAAVSGLRPVIEIMFGDFLPLAMDSLVNQAAKYWFISNQQASVPLVVRSAVGAGGRFGAIHSQFPVSWFQGVPGIKVVAPATSGDAKAFLEHKRLYSVKDPPPETELLEIGKASVAREGADLTIVSVSKGVRDALAAAEQLASEHGIDAEVVDLRTLRPVDVDTVLESVAKTNRVLAVEEGPRTGGWATGLLGAISERALHDLDDAWIIATDEAPIPYSPPLEDAFLPDTPGIVAEVVGRLHENAVAASELSAPVA